MGTFDPAPSYRVASPQENAQTALDMPLTPLNNLWQQTQAGLLGTFDTGTLLKDFTTPRGVGTIENPAETIARLNPVLGAPINVYEGVRSVFGAPTTGTPMSEADYKASDSYRPAIPYDKGMTTDRAAALADQYDLTQARAYFGQKDKATTIAGNLVGGLISPSNFVPVFGEAATAAAAAKFGYVAGHALIGASSAAINTAIAGAVTAPLRAQYGEDVSFEAQLNNIGMSALFGAAIGGLGGFLSRDRAPVAPAVSTRAALADRNIQGATETIPNLQDARTILNDAVGSKLESGDVTPTLSPRSKALLDQLAANVTDRRTAVQALDAETANVTAPAGGSVAIAPSGARIGIQPEVVDLSTLQRATDGLQVRDRSPTNAVSNAQIENIATKLDPARLMPNADASQGAPIVGPDNVVDSGNGRVAALARVYDAYPQQAAAYKQALVDAGYPQAAGMDAPVLISRRTTPLSDTARAQFNAEVNGPSVATMSASELADMDRGALTDSVMAAHDPEAPITAASNRGFVARFLGELPQNERNRLVSANGDLSSDGVRRIQNAMVAKAYGDVDPLALRKFAEATDDNTRSIVGALSDVAPRWIEFRRAIGNGEVGPEFDATAELTEALRKLSGWRDQAASEKRPVGTVIKEGMAQGDLLSGSMPAPTKVFVRMFYTSDDFTQAAGRDMIAGRLADYARAATELGQPDMLGEAYAATKLGVLQSGNRDFGAELFEAPRFADGSQDFRSAGGQSSARANLEGDRAALGANRRGGTEPGNVGAGDAARAADTAAARVTDYESLVASQPARSLDELYAVAPEHQAELGRVGRDLAGNGADFRDPGVKSRATSEEKMQRKRYDSTRRLTDVVRGGFVVKTPADADRVVAGLGAHFGKVLDEGWRITEAGYFDRKVMVQFKDGTVGEVQFWHPDMIDLKESTGHKLYEEMRGLAPDDPKFLDLLDKQKELYLSAVGKASDDWLPVLSKLTAELEGGLPASGNDLSKAASESLTPESTTSAASTLTHEPPDETMAQAELPLITAGRDSQSKNVSFTGQQIDQPAANVQETTPAPITESLKEAAARVGTAEDFRALAAQHGLSPDGSFPEEAVIDMMREQNVLSASDKAELDQADQTVANAKAWGQALITAARCAFGAL